MEGVGARLGRSSTRYGGPATVFTGPVRKWRKKWIHVSPSNAGSSSNHHRHHNSNTNGNANGAHLLLYKWTPIPNNDLNSNKNQDSGKTLDLNPEEEPPRRKFKYIPIALLEEQKDEAAEQVEVEDAVKPIDTETVAADPDSKTNGIDEKPDINNVPVEENQARDNPLGRQDLNESTMDLRLNLNSNDGENDSDSITDQVKDGKLE